MATELLMHVLYKVKEGKREEFLQKIKENGIMAASKQEPGNLTYQYYYPVEDDNSILLVESWTGKEAQELHCNAEHFHKLSELKKEYVEKVRIRKYEASEINS